MNEACPPATEEFLMQFKLLLLGLLCAVLPSLARPQTPTDMAVLRGLAPVTVLSKTPEGSAALAANYTVSGGIQTGAIRQSTLLPFAEQQQQALQDAFITAGNLAQLADGLGTTLGSAYLARAHYLDRTHFTSLAQSVTDIIAYAVATSSANAGSGKFFFANLTTDSKTSVSSEAAAILKTVGGETDVFGKAYGFPSGAVGADAFGNSRPFQTESNVLAIHGHDYFNTPADNGVYNHGPIMDLTNSPSFPSGHTTYGYTGAILLGLLVPERYPEMIARAAEYGNDRILMGAHYAMDVIGGRTLALYDLAHLLANDPAYVGLSPHGAAPIRDFTAAMKTARSVLTSALQAACGKEIQECAVEDTGRFSNRAANEAFYADTQTYNLPVVYPKAASAFEDVAKIAPEAGHLLTAAFPALSMDQADQILTETEGPGGGFLDDGSAFGVYSRLDLYAAVNRAVAIDSRHASAAVGGAKEPRPQKKYH
jgi:hypothetical protein